ncbi:MAG: flagellar protein FlaG [Pseudomonadales bacterium]|nr:flagellar protein FlaG [Pseudomonadales bacterium]
MSDFSIRPSDSTSPPNKKSVRNEAVETETNPKKNTAQNLTADDLPTEVVDKNLSKESVDSNPSVTVEDAVVKLEAFTQSIGRDLLFRIDKSSGKTIISVVDPDTKEVIREIPGEDALKLSSEIHQMRSLVFSAKA